MHISKLKPDHCLNLQYIVKQWQCGFNLSTKHPYEIKNKFEYSYLKSIIYLDKNYFFTIFQLRLKYFVIEIILVLNIFAILGLTCFEPNWTDKNVLRHKSSTMFSK